MSLFLSAVYLCGPIFAWTHIVPCDITHFLVPRAGNKESGFGEPDTSQVVIANLLRSIVAMDNMEAALDGSAETRQICFAKLMDTWSRCEEIITKLLDNTMDQKKIDLYTEE
ncbi:hypothetical protein T12_15007 [Trichinella patagoniensis]|uniref:Uncharacterized protein n=1 Tax=Trichinella patagoniensis TaxID=990121 RepID=A0A0V0ZTZ2_9BILA|nr:hypothetical protein T12_15007 [Trichinella patagoniensis]